MAPAREGITNYQKLIVTLLPVSVSCAGKPISLVEEDSRQKKMV
jgi:hypothetical protein